MTLQVVGENPVAEFSAVILKMCNLTAIDVVDAKTEGAASFMVGTTEYAVPLGNMIDVEAEIARMEAELKHKEGFLQGVMKKLSNEKFVNSISIYISIYSQRTYHKTFTFFALIHLLPEFFGNERHERMKQMKQIIKIRNRSTMN